MRNYEKEKEYKRQWRLRNKEHIAAYNAAYNEANKERIKEWHDRPENKEKIKARSEAWSRNNPDRVRARHKAWLTKNPWKWRLDANKYKAAKIRAIPKWADQFIITEIYDLATMRTKKLGSKWHVDHIIPLKSKIVCGLHCEANLRVIPAKENERKNNRWWPDMPSPPCRTQEIPPQQLRHIPIKEV